MQQSYFSSSDIINMEQRKRTAFINSLSGFKSASLIGSVDSTGNHNLAVFSSVVHIGSNPPLIGFISRPDTTSRHTLENILDTKCFTVNHVHSGIYKQAHQTAARYDRHISEFEATGLTPEFSEKIMAPYVKESRIKFGISFAEKHHLTINGTILVIGKIEEVFFPPHCLLQDGTLDIEKAETIAVSGLDSYHHTQRLSRLTYAKPHSFPEEIP
jgi:flavin reductase (DIM6/NTAB) family NADH-FMN oxidoreductase RutF